jgi:lysophospholipase L1-like esterase
MQRCVAAATLTGKFAASETSRLTLPKNRIALPDSGWNGVIGFLTASLFGACISAAQPASTAPQSPEHRIRIALIGDSTQTDNAGYGRGFCANLVPTIDCVNMAKGGASTKTFRNDGLWDKSLALQPDYMLIQFGHNDMVSPEHLDRQVPIDGYRQNLRNFVNEARTHRITPVLVTPLTRRYFGSDGKIHSDLTEYSNALKSVAAELKVPLIDLQALSIDYLNRTGEAQSSTLGITKKDARGATVPDKTHLSWQGSFIFGRIVAENLGKAVPQLAPFILPQPATLPAEGQLAMRVLAKSPFKIVLVGDSTVAIGGGWGPGFCQTLTPNVTCIDDARNGRSTKSFIDEGAWNLALAEHGQYYLIQFGHNDQKPDPARHTDPDTTYAANLQRFIRDVRAQGAIPILLTPLSRRNYADGQLITTDGLGDYAAAVLRVASTEHVTEVDLYALSARLLSAMTQQEADTFDLAGHPDAKAESAAGKPDRTHLNEKGSKFFGRLIADNLIRTQVELGPNVIGVPAGNAVEPIKQAAPTDGK